MKLLKRLWDDEEGVILSSEVVLLGTIGVLGLTTGLSFLTAAVNSELQEVGLAIRSLDQSYAVKGSGNCYSRTPGSSYQQMAVQQTILDLRNTDCLPSIQGDGGLIPEANGNGSADDSVRPDGNRSGQSESAGTETDHAYSSESAADANDRKNRRKKGGRSGQHGESRKQGEGSGRGLRQKLKDL